MRVLIVDDDESFRATLAMLLELEGFEVDCAASGRAALRKLDQGSFDVMIVDVRMPGMTGDILIRRVRDVNTTTRIIMVTASPLAFKDRIVHIGSGANLLRMQSDLVDGYLHRPYTLEGVREAITKVFQDGASGNRARRTGNID